MRSAWRIANGVYCFAAIAAQHDAMEDPANAASAVREAIRLSKGTTECLTALHALEFVAEAYCAAGQKFSAEVAKLLEGLVVAQSTDSSFV